MCSTFAPASFSEYFTAFEALGVCNSVDYGEFFPEKICACSGGGGGGAGILRRGFRDENLLKWHSRLQSSDICSHPGPKRVKASAIKSHGFSAGSVAPARVLQSTQ